MSWLDDVHIRHDAPTSGAAAAIIASHLPAGWQRDAAAEARFVSETCNPEAYCFNCEETPSRISAAVWLVVEQPQRLHVINVLPRGGSSMTYETHNQVIKSFHDDVLIPVGKSQGWVVEYESGCAIATLEDDISAESLRKLKAISRFASYGLMGEASWEKWNEFVIQTHVEDANIDTALLASWLESQGWSQADRETLLAAYYHQRSVLADYAHACGLR